MVLKFKPYFKNILNEVHPGLQLSKESSAVIEKILTKLLDKLIKHSSIDFRLVLTEVLGGDLATKAF